MVSAFHSSVPSLFQSRIYSAFSTKKRRDKTVIAQIRLFCWMSLSRFHHFHSSVAMVSIRVIDQRFVDSCVGYQKQQFTKLNHTKQDTFRHGQLSGRFKRGFTFCDVFQMHNHQLEETKPPTAKTKRAVADLPCAPQKRRDEYATRHSHFPQVARFDFNSRIPRTPPRAMKTSLGHTPPHEMLERDDAS